MVQVLPHVKIGSERFLEAFTPGAAQAIGNLSPQQDPKIKQMMIAEALKAQNPLNKAKQELAEAKTGQIKSQAKLFEDISGNTENQKAAPFFLIPEEEDGEIEEQVPPELKSKLSQVPSDKLSQLAAFKGQPGEQGIIGNMADAEQTRRKESEKLDYQSFKDNKEYTEKVLNGYESYKRDSQVLDQMDQLAKKGELTSPFGNFVLQKLGLPLGILGNPDSEQFEKLSQELMKNITGTYGSRILQTEVVSFMKSIPTLMNSPEGQKRLIKQWKLLNEGKKIYYESYKDVRKKTPNRLPPDLHEKVIDASEKKLDKISDEFRKMNSFIDVKGPDGKIYPVPEDQLNEALSQGGSLI